VITHRGGASRRGLRLALAQSMTAMTGGRFGPQKGGLPVVVDEVWAAPCERAAQAGQDDVSVLETALAAAPAGLVATDLCDALPERREPSLEE
jgi:hypothetical protein